MKGLFLVIAISSAIPNLKFCEEDEYLAFLLHKVQELLNPIYQQLLEAFGEYQTFFQRFARPDPLYEFRFLG